MKKYEVHFAINGEEMHSKNEATFKEVIQLYEKYLEMLKGFEKEPEMIVFGAIQLDYLEELLFGDFR